jgi:hypothetical protein
MEFQRHACVPLRIGHVEQIDLRHIACNVEQRIDATKTFHRFRNDDLCRIVITQIQGNHQRLCAGSLYFLCCLIQFLRVSGNQHHCREILCESNGCGATDALTCPSNDCNVFHDFSFIFF